MEMEGEKEKQKEEEERQRELQVSRETIGRLETLLRQSEQQHTALTTQLEALRSQSLVKEEEYQTHLRQLTLPIGEDRGMTSAFAEEKLQVLTEIAKLKENVESSHQSEAQWTLRATEAESLLTEATQKLRETEESLSAARRRVSELEERLSSLDEKLTQANHEVTEAKEVASSLSLTLETERAKSSEERVSIEEERRKMDEERGRWRGEREKWKAFKDQWREEKAKNEEEKKQLHAAISTLTEELKKSQVTEREKREMREREKAEWERERGLLLQEGERREGERAQWEREKEQLTKELGEENSRLGEELLTHRERARRREESLKTQLDRLSDDVASISKQRDQLHAQLEREREEREEGEAEREEERERERLRIREFEEEIERLGAETNSLKRIIHEVVPDSLWNVSIKRCCDTYPFIHFPFFSFPFCLFFFRLILGFLLAFISSL